MNVLYRRVSHGKMVFFCTIEDCLRSENKDGLSDEQVENLLLNEDCTDMLTISK